MKIIKADNYQSWYIEYLNNSIIIDPWLTTKLQPENSFFIQRSKNRNSSLSQDQINKVKAIIITAPFEDHLHIESIKMFSKEITIYTSKIVSKSLIKNKLDNNLPTIPTTIKEELECNIFLRSKDVKSFSKLRDLKDKF